MIYKQVSMADGFHTTPNGKYAYQMTKCGKRYLCEVRRWGNTGDQGKAVVLNNYGVRAIKMTLVKWINTHAD